jgi:hypothetical protein
VVVPLVPTRYKEKIMADDKKKSGGAPQEDLQKDPQVGATLLDDKIANAVRLAMESAMPMAMAAAAQILGTTLNPKKPDPIAEKYSATDRCSKCLQMKRACKEEHVLMRVAPANPRRFKRFPGAIVGGVLYISPNPNARIWVPKENDIMHIIQTWEAEEDNLREGHSIDHNSGVISPVEGNNNTVPANTRGFREKLEGAPEGIN